MAKNRIGLGIIPAGLAFVGTVAVAARYRREMRAARERVDRLGSEVIQTDCGPIEYARVGDGYPVLVVHGAMGGFDQGLSLANNLDSSFEVIAVSRFGHLRSPLQPGANFNLQADAYACLLDALGIDRVAVFAASAGANTSIRFVARYPQRVSGLILLSPAAPGKVMPTEPPRGIFETLMRNDFVYWASITFFKARMQSLVGVPKGFVPTPEQQTVIDSLLAETLPASKRMDGFLYEMYSPEWKADFYGSISDTSPHPLGEIKAPVLVMNALDDPLALPENVRALADKIPNARLFVVPDGGHQLLGHAEAVKAEIAQFLKTIVSESNIGH